MKFNWTKEVCLAYFDFENDAYKCNGEARLAGNKEIQQVNGTIYKDGAYAGSFSSSPSTEGELKMNISGVSAENLSAVAEMVNAIAVEVKAKRTA